MKYTIDFCFKGKRTYIQGPDIFDAVVEKIKENYDFKKILNIKYAAHEMLHTNATLTFVQDKDFDKSNYKVINSVITFNINKNKIFGIVSSNNELIECSNKYSEDIVRNNSLIENNIISFKNTTEDSYTELIVSMNKYFLQTTIPLEGKWIVSQLKYNNIIDIIDINDKILKIEMKHNFNNKLVKSSIHINESCVGELFFSLI